MKNLLFQLCLIFLVWMVLSTFFVAIQVPKFSYTPVIWFGLFALIAGIASRIEKYMYHTFFITHPKTTPSYNLGVRRA